MLPSLPTLRSSLLRMYRVIFDIDEITWRSHSALPLTNLERMVIVLEDRRFFWHKGIDARSIVRELFKALTLRRFGGASTIDVQLFRTVSDRYERTARRKLREFVGAYALQKKFSKIQLLRAYLNVAYFGTGLRGADAASQDEYGKNASELSLEEAAVIASFLVYPKPSISSLNWRTKIGRRADYGCLLVRTLEKGNYQTLG